jgi:hypothetical protein
MLLLKLLRRLRRPSSSIALALSLISAFWAPSAVLAQAAENSQGAAEQAAQRQALGFLGYLDQGRFADSYAYTGVLMRNQLDPQTYAAKIENMRAGVGALQGRQLIDANPTNTVPGAPEGQYIVLHYHANYQNLNDAVETITLAYAKGYWRVIGYYIK